MPFFFFLKAWTSGHELKKFPSHLMITPTDMICQWTDDSELRRLGCHVCYELVFEMVQYRNLNGVCRHQGQVKRPALDSPRPLLYDCAHHRLALFSEPTQSAWVSLTFACIVSRFESLLNTWFMTFPQFQMQKICSTHRHPSHLKPSSRFKSMGRVSAPKQS